MGFKAVAGLDEVGMGPLAGPAVAAAVILPLGVRLPGLDDSKRLPQRRREAVELEIRRRARALAVGVVEAEEIDRHGLTWARERAMRIAVESLATAADYLLIDAYDLPPVPLPQLAVIKGDTFCASIMAASVVAKVYRDRLMQDYDRAFPGYGFALHKGYATELHRSRLAELGPCPIHRLSWLPLRALREGDSEGEAGQRVGGRAGSGPALGHHPGPVADALGGVDLGPDAVEDGEAEAAVGSPL